MVFGVLRTRRATRSAPYTGAATVCLLLAVAVRPSGLLILVLGRVVPGWATGAALILGSVVLRRAGEARRPPERDRAAPRRAALARYLRVALMVLGGWMCVLGALLDLTAHYEVLRPAGPDGCTAVVREAAFLYGHDGELYTVGQSGTAWKPSASWHAANGHHAAPYELRWTGDGGTLAVSGIDAAPGTDGPLRFGCG
ncbi:hypothetical protein OHT52_10645 [Streptomyces sp. NBC_00247]|uniref:hypothetical protein n=1 Tax=Streptomyces sp. NBC_00247 TaxID=2975689 RepID=UPI002E2E88DD|nr:hypothetical protein [Streptomyces sp. NBC_00247]